MSRFFVNCRFLTQQLTGVQRYASELALGLKRAHADVRYVSPSRIRQSEWAKVLGSEPLGSSSGHLWEQVALPRFLRRDPQAVLLNLANTAPLFLNRQVVTLHDLAYLAHPEWFSWRFAKYYQTLIPRIARSAMHVIVISEFTRKEVIAYLGIPEDHISVIPPAVSDRILCSAPAITPPVDGEFVLAVASMNPRKNLGAVVRAFDSIGDRSLRLVLVGEHHRSFAAMELPITTGAAGRVIHLGRVSDEVLSWLYQHAQMLVFPSLYEGFGLPPLEAAQAGCPSVVSNAASLPEVMGQAALYCDPQDVSDIATQMKRLLVDSTLRSRLIELGKVRATEFAWGASVTKLQVLLENLSTA